LPVRLTAVFTPVSQGDNKDSVKGSSLYVFSAGALPNDELLTLLASSAERLRNGAVSVRPSVCPVDRQPLSSSDVQLLQLGARGRYRSLAAGAAYRLSTDICCSRPSSTAGSVML